MSKKKRGGVRKWYVILFLDGPDYINLHLWNLRDPDQHSRKTYQIPADGVETIAFKKSLTFISSNKKCMEKRGLPTFDGAKD